MHLNECEIEKVTRLATEVATKTYYELAKQENAQLGRKLRHNTIKLLKHYSQLQSYVDNAMKKKCTEQVKEQCLSQQIESVKGKVDLLFEWHSSTRHDPDNVAFAKKFILDGLQAAGVLENDNRKFIGTMADEVVNDDDDFVIVHITEHMSIFL